MTHHRPTPVSSLVAWLLAALVLAAVRAPAAQPVYRWTTLAGRASLGSEDGSRTEARFNEPHALAFDPVGNLYIADTGNHTIRRITPAGVVSTFAGKAGEPGDADGAGSAARFRSPRGLAIDRNGNVYVADTGNHTIRMITPAGGVSTLAGQSGKPGYADGSAAVALFDAPAQIAADGLGNLYVLSSGLRRISGGIVSRLYASTGTEEITASDHLAADPNGNVFFTIGSGSSLMKLTPSGAMSVLDTKNTWFLIGASYRWIGPLVTDEEGDVHFVGGHSVAGSLLYRLCTFRTDGTLALDQLEFDAPTSVPSEPRGLALRADATVYFTHSSDAAVGVAQRKRTPEVFAGTPKASDSVNAPGAAARFNGIACLSAPGSDGLLVGDKRKWFAATVGRFSSCELRRIPFDGSAPATLFTRRADLAERWNDPRGCGADSAGHVYFAWTASYTGDHLIRAEQGAPFTELLHDVSIQAREYAFGAFGDIYVIDQQRRIHHRSPDGQWRVLAGDIQPPEITDGVGATARFGDLRSIAVAPTGEVYVLDSLKEEGIPTRCVIRRVGSDGRVATISSNLVHTLAAASETVVDAPNKLGVTSDGAFVLVYENTHQLTLLHPSGTEFVIGGTQATPGSADGIGTNARFHIPGAVTAGSDGAIYVADDQGATVRKGVWLGCAPEITTQPTNRSVSTGATATFTVAATGTPAPVYQWYFNGTAIAGATSATLSLSYATVTNAGDYTVIVSNGAGSVTSNKATLTVTSAPTPPPPSTGGGGGGGAPSLWFGVAIAPLVLLRRRFR